MEEKIWHFENEGNDIPEVYYKLLRKREGFVTVICLQDFDELDYNHNHIIKNSDGKEHTFDTEDLAIKFLNDKFEIKEIDPDFFDQYNNIRD